MRRIIEATSATLEESIRNRRLKWIVGVPTGILGAISFILMCLDVELAAYATSTVLSLWLVCCVFILAISRRYMRREINMFQGIAEHYGRHIYETQSSSPGYFRVLSWNEVQVLRSDGSVDITRDLTISPVSEILRAVWTSAESSRGALSDTELDRLYEGLRTPILNDDDSEGIDLRRAVFRGTGAEVIFNIFPLEAVQPGDALRFRLSLSWPKYAEKLVTGSIDENYWEFAQEVEYFHFEMHLPSELGVSADTLKLSPLKGTTYPKKDTTPTGVVVSFEISKVEALKRYGFNCQILGG